MHFQPPIPHPATLNAPKNVFKIPKLNVLYPQHSSVSLEQEQLGDSRSKSEATSTSKCMSPAFETKA
ncbi:hypothetical protein QTJ16_006657 [Diplocarpon rosae]|uniref:Uncharacterized protein n=1 Tax=Diplocarpon rosae TaxID=946125 RepID=A0AAD9SSU2_9HELO|nr:hypothetical protein QTJ16_006657 [Diplocarpon rosae]